MSCIFITSVTPNAYPRLVILLIIYICIIDYILINLFNRMEVSSCKNDLLWKSYFSCIFDPTPIILVFTACCYINLHRVGKMFMMLCHINTEYLINFYLFNFKMQHSNNFIFPWLNFRIYGQKLRVKKSLYCYCFDKRENSKSIATLVQSLIRLILSFNNDRIEKIL